MGIIPDLLSVLPRYVRNSVYAVSAHGEVTHGRDSLRIIRDFFVECKDFLTRTHGMVGKIFSARCVGADIIRPRLPDTVRITRAGNTRPYDAIRF